MITEVVAEDWSCLNELLFRDTWDADIKRFRSTFAYRGVSVESYPLTNGLSRIGVPYPRMESNLIKQFKKYAHPHVVERDTEWHWLSIAQHHGLPTRLLDWTYSPLVAMHFATADLSAYGADGAIWKVDFAQAHELLQHGYRVALDRLGAKIFTVDALAETLRGLEDMDSLSSLVTDVAIFFEPPAIDQRIVNQFAYFSVLSDPFLSFDDWLRRPEVETHVDACKIILPMNKKWEFRDKLDQSNVSERVLMTGLDGLCSWLKRHYTPI